MRKLLLFILFVFGILFLSGCSVEDPEVAADRFARFWEQKDWNNMYNMFIPELQAKSDKDTFVFVMNYFEKEQQVVIRLDKVSMDNKDTAFVYYTVSSSLFDAKAPAMKMVLVDREWKINAFANYFGIKKEDLIYTAEINKLMTTMITNMQERSQFSEDISDLMDRRNYGDYSQNVYDVCVNYPEDNNFVTKFKMMPGQLASITPPEKFKEHYASMNKLINIQINCSQLTYNGLCSSTWISQINTDELGKCLQDLVIETKRSAELINASLE